MSKGFLDPKEKEKLINLEKEAAMASSGSGGMEKIASFRADMQSPYPSPFLNLSDMQLPQSTIEVFKWCKYYYTFDPLISGAINALATFPVTEVYLEDESNRSKTDKKAHAQQKLYEKVLFKKLNIYKLLIEIGIDYFLYGNCFIMGELKGEGTDKEWSNMIRLDPSKIVIDFNPATGAKRYKWQVPNKIRNIVMRKQPKEEYDKIPDLVKEAVKKNKVIALNPENIFHFSRATDSMGDNSVWGVPIVANVLKLLMYRNILRQAQEAIAREHIVPMRIYYLDRTNSVNIQADWNKVATDLANEIKKSVRDPNHKVVSPVPVNVINVGGEGRGLLLTPEIEQIQAEILAGMNVPREFIFGGINYSGSSISLRILENQFITYRLLLTDFLQNFVIRKMAQARGEWVNEDDDDKIVSIKLAELKMQDDVQQKQLVIQLNSAGKCSNDYMWKSMGIDPDKMKEAIKKEALENLELENEVQRKRMENEIKNIELQHKLQMAQTQSQMQIQALQQQMQLQIQEAMAPMQEEQQMQQQEQQMQQQDQQAQQQQQQQAEQNDQAINKEIDRIALDLAKMPQEQRQQFLSSVPGEVKQQVEAKIKEYESIQGKPEQQGQGKGEAGKTDMRPMPEQRPPRRNSAK